MGKRLFSNIHWTILQKKKKNNTVEFLVFVVPNSTITVSKSTLTGAVAKQLLSLGFYVYNQGIVI